MVLLGQRDKLPNINANRRRIKGRASEISLAQFNAMERDKEWMSQEPLSFLRQLLGWYFVLAILVRAMFIRWLMVAQRKLALLERFRREAAEYETQATRDSTSTEEVQQSGAPNPLFASMNYRK